MSHDGHPDGLSEAELEAQGAEGLPDREAMSVLNPTPDIPAIPEVPGLLDLDVDLALDANVAAPIDAAVAANANVAAPIDAAVSANVASPDAVSQAVADQDSVIVQELDGEANATANQTAAVEQGGGTAGAGAGAQTGA
jgi:hypothetical protein